MMLDLSGPWPTKAIQTEFLVEGDFLGLTLNVEGNKQLSISFLGEIRWHINYKHCGKRFTCFMCWGDMNPAVTMCMMLSLNRKKILRH